MSILLTLATRSLAPRISANGGKGMSMLEVPDFAIRKLSLRGLSVPASMLAGWSLDQFDRLRDRADKAGCPCLVLIEDTPLSFVDPDEAAVAASAERIRRLAVAANRLGCNALALQFEADDTEEALEGTAAVVKELMPAVERFELNVLVAPGAGLTADPDRLTELIKRIGGFRIGSMPSFEHAASTGDPVDTLRKLAPYAGAIQASIKGFDKAGKHVGYDLFECVSAIRSVGFLNNLAIDYTGKGDPIENIDRAREILEAAIEAEPE